MKIDINMEEFMNYSKKFFDSSDIKNIMEIGSLDGRDSLYFKEHYPNANVFCIEGLPSNYQNYLSNLDTITPINIVIADYDGMITFHHKNINGIHGILNRGDQYGTDTLSLPCKTIKTICKEYKIDNIDLVKIDVEGASYEILNSMGDKLKDIKIMHIETESYPFFKGQKLHSEVEVILLENGFELIELSSVNIGIGKQHDSVWVNKKYLK
jgi:FkbM family methyltransferase